MLVYFIAFGIFYSHLVKFMSIWSILWSIGIYSRFGKLYQEKSGKPAFNKVLAPYRVTVTQPGDTFLCLVKTDMAYYKPYFNTTYVYA
jgi:hypothetical protein